MMCVVLLVVLFHVLVADELYKEKWRPQFHFTPPSHWMNDPNGLSFFNNNYHMFFQYNAEGIIIANQSWGHSISTNLVDWEYQGIAIPRGEKSFIFSGCAVVHENTLNAIYTVYHETEKGIIEDEYLSISEDGFKFVDFPGNPILTHHSSQLQDPNVHLFSNSDDGSESYFVMAISIPDDRLIQFYNSSDLRTWTYLSQFGKVGSVEYHWEMPVLTRIRSFPGHISSDNDDEEMMMKEDVYLLIVNVGYYAQYFFGTFDGVNFKTFESDPKKIRLVDYGPDFFETQTFYQSKEIGDRVILIANVVNYHYALNLPTKKWRNTQSLPRELFYEKLENGEYRLKQIPVSELEVLRTGVKKELENVMIHPNEEIRYDDISYAKTMEIFIDDICYQHHHQTEHCGLEIHVLLGNNTNQKTIIGYNEKEGFVYIDRKDSGVSNFSEYYEEHTIFQTPKIDEIRSLRIFVDWSSIEVFVNDGEYTMTAVVFPNEYSDSVVVRNNLHLGTVNFGKIIFYQLRSIHKNDMS